MISTLFSARERKRERNVINVFLVKYLLIAKAFYNVQCLKFLFVVVAVVEKLMFKLATCLFIFPLCGNIHKQRVLHQNLFIYVNSLTIESSLLLHLHHCMKITLKITFLIELFYILIISN